LPHPYFTIVLNGTITEDATKSIAQQTFPLWEILIEGDKVGDGKYCWGSTLIIHPDRIRCRGAPRGVWKVEAALLSSDSLLEDMLEQMRTYPMARNHTVNSHRVEFIYDASIGIHRLAKPLLNYARVL
jgi:hypothetical protein